ncbi:MerR family transcriptional regulator [Deferribacter desulfuricans]|uniref:MerR family transcriptional regulator n=1 Tax=Deferribacter desulfuricans TaxID=197162 RepID=UPI00030A6906|nr:MerR family transcriptional regulator [Deferribacter desulfuricans]
MTYLKRGQLAKIVGVNLETIRYYEQIGLLKPKRSKSNYRLFSEEDVTKLQFIKKSKELGFTLKEIKELLELSLDDTSTCLEIKK